MTSVDGKISLEIFNQELRLLYVSGNELDFSFGIANGMSDTIDVLNDMAEHLNQLADL